MSAGSSGSHSQRLHCRDSPERISSTMLFSHSSSAPRRGCRNPMYSQDHRRSRNRDTQIILILQAPQSYPLSFQPFYVPHILNFILIGTYYNGCMLFFQGISLHLKGDFHFLSLYPPILLIIGTLINENPAFYLYIFPCSQQRLQYLQ